LREIGARAVVFEGERDAGALSEAEPAGARERRFDAEVAHAGAHELCHETADELAGGLTGARGGARLEVDLSDGGCELALSLARRLGRDFAALGDREAGHHVDATLDE